jgi:type IV secretory pathway VirB4 component
MPSGKPTQDFLPIKEIRDGVLILKDNSLRVILMASSINFDLQSEDIQEATILQFQNFLNVLDFSVEIFIESRRMDIKPYLAQLEQRYKEQLNDLLKIQIREYVNFIGQFTQNSNIMSKRFFVVVPFASTLMSGGSSGLSNTLSDMIPSGTSKKPAGTKSEQEKMTFEENRVQLEQRVSIAEQALLRCGIRSVRLGTEELVEFYYKLFNPGESHSPVVSNS